MNWYFEAVMKYAEFGGRARRKEYWYFILFNTIFGIVLAVVDDVTGNTDATTGIGLFGAVYGLIMILPHLGVTVRRLHDTDRSGWWILIGLIPLLGWVVLLVFLVEGGDPGSNQYGQDPKRARFSPAGGPWSPESREATGMSAPSRGATETPHGGSARTPQTVDEPVRMPLRYTTSPAAAGAGHLQPRAAPPHGYSVPGNDGPPPRQQTYDDGSIRVSFLGGSATRVRSISATVSAADALAAGFLEFLATLPYEGAEPTTARDWVTANIAYGGETTIGGARFILSGPSGGRSLDILGFGPM